MTQAAILIQSKFRSYYEQKRFQQSRRAAVLIQQYYRSYKEYEKLKQGRRGALSLQQRMRWASSHSKRWILQWVRGKDARIPNNKLVRLAYCNTSKVYF